MKIRDILAIPFWVLSMGLDRIALIIGGEWTAKMFIETVERQAEALTKPNNPQ